MRMGCIKDKLKRKSSVMENGRVFSSNFSRNGERLEIVLVDGKFKISYIDWEMLYALWMTMVTDYWKVKMLSVHVS